MSSYPRESFNIGLEVLSTSLLISSKMKKFCIDQLRQVLSSPTQYEVRHVPQVMYQIIVLDTPTTEVRFHIYEDCKETYIHNHKHPFLSYGLQGGYTEKIWRWDKDEKSKFFCFVRHKGGQLNAPHEFLGRLSQWYTRKHFVGNILTVGNNSYHSIASASGRELPVTLIIKDKSLDSGQTLVLSKTREIHEPIIPIRSPGREEVANCLKILERILKKFERDNPSLLPMLA
ncbi:hypothetical protein UNDKW_4021 [Undibacterium sp. KW1]|uniref:hypothetical protein n=1 Tax=Undibacterium sp. KW1 TaxID=2058624 RepID=UPI001331F1CC|nr:hypothetical protein [Undibacterium sp. KW1]BBB62276.1 hypothetical protein UNDKW_4003 [Undibacterium sp. KW1]BBB62294.1 hypothetical protein UNDKW_4021 [Undibacterium sp. KW1]